ncbi:MAG: DNA polymerase III subunit gamma/tau [Bacteroidales bacterium]|nr:DNA polymerase III subunit gamma/tau [Bacteroidales bacterium]MCM1414945.1 DNA polymerase III subunit gamma/tau [bacterium]MCM1424791.1 DNA polymerase III subunit gamma/tau [bacterium]
MSYTALYRKFRPSRFEEVKGQEHIVTTLQNQIKADRIGHAYLFCGTRGTGKTSIAKIFARAVNCEHPVEGSPCGECASCRAIAAGTSMNVIEIDAASNNGVDNIREIVEEVSYSPAEGRFKVYIIDEVHMLSIGAFNALLKTLEEPPSYVIFILATTEVHKIPITILSRCQRYDFRRITIDTITERLRELMEKEGVQAEEKALRYVAKTADGSMRDALSLLDQCIAFHFGQELTYDKALDVLGAVDTEVFGRLFGHILKREVTGCIELLQEIVMQGRELSQFVADFTWYLRNLMLLKSADDIEDIIDASSDHLALMREEADMVEMETLMRFIRIFSELSGQIRYASQKRITIEIALIKLCRPDMEKDFGSVVERVRVIEEQLENGVVPALSGAQGFGGESAQEQPKKERPPLPKAIPEDVQAAVERWHDIVANTTMPMRQYLQKAHLTLGGDSRLLIMVEDGLASDYFLKQEGHKEVLEQMLADAMGKEIDVTVQTVQNREAFEQNYVDLSQLIHMEIEEE